MCAGQMGSANSANWENTKILNDDIQHEKRLAKRGIESDTKKIWLDGFKKFVAGRYNFLFCFNRNNINKYFAICILLLGVLAF